MMEAISIEVFLSEGGVCLAVPRDCGLEFASMLLVDRKSCSLTAMSGDEILPVTLPNLSPAHCDALLTVGKIAVGEFVLQGVAAAYFLDVQSA